MLTEGSPLQIVSLNFPSSFNRKSLNTITTVRIWEKNMGAEGQKVKAVWLHVLMGVCMCVYHWPRSQKGAAALLIHGHFVLHWVTDVLEMYITGFLRKVAAGCAWVCFNLRKWQFLPQYLNLGEHAAKCNNAVLKIGPGHVVLPSRPGSEPKEWSMAGGPDKNLPQSCDKEKGASLYELFWLTPWIPQHEVTYHQIHQGQKERDLFQEKRWFD